MNFQQLNYILAVEEFQNFNRAAIACDVAQSTLSREIQRLEQEYQIIIFDRTRNPVVPTLKGIDLLKKAKDILNHQKEFIRIAHKRNNEVSGKINLAVTEILAPYLIPPFIYNLTKKYPELELEILELSDRRIEDLLIEEKIDAAIMISPSLSHGYYESKLYEEEILLYSTAPIETKANKISLNDIDFGTILIHEDLKIILERQLEGLFKTSPSKQVKRVKFLKGNLETLKNIIQYNGGSMMLPKLAKSFLSTKDQNNIYSFSEIPPKLDVSLIAARGFEKNRIIKKIIEEIVRSIPQDAN